MTEDDFRRDLSALETTSEHNVRNQLALDLAGAALTEAQGDAVKAALILLIGRDDLRNNRGTLVHSLNHFDCSDTIVLLADLVATGGYEAAHEAFDIFDGIEEADDADIARSVSLVRAALVGEMETWRREMLSELLEILG